MKNIFFPFFISIVVLSCNNKTADNKKEVSDNKIALHDDTLNVVKLTDTLVIYESTCRGCAYETSTNFNISDSMHIIELNSIVTIDNNSSEMSGGSVSKSLVLVPVKTGITKIKMYKFWTMEKSPKDSANFKTYNIEVKN